MCDVQYALLRKAVPKMTNYVLSGTLNLYLPLTHSSCPKICFQKRIF